MLRAERREVGVLITGMSGDLRDGKVQLFCVPVFCHDVEGEAENTENRRADQEIDCGEDGVA